VIRKGDRIRHRKSKRQWRVLEIRKDGLLEVERQTSRGVKRRVILRPEEYLSMSDKMC